MPTRLNPYLSFKDNASEVIDFYQSVFGGTVDKNTFGGSGMPCEPDETDLIMHAQLETEAGLMLMASDTPKQMGGEARPNGTISLSGDDEAELRGYYEKLSSDGGQVTMPLEKADWGDYFGMCQDKFGVDWMVNIAGKAVESEG